MSGFQIFALCMAFLMANMALYWLYHLSIRVSRIETFFEALCKQHEDQ